MKDSKNIVIITMIVILITSILVSVIGWNTREYDSNFSNQTCTREGKYCIFNDIPNGMQYTKPSESLKDVPEFDGDLLDYVDQSNNKYFPNEPIRTREPLYSVWDLQGYTCKSTNKTPQAIEYFDEFCGGTGRGEGCGNSRRALVCGDGYLIQESIEYNSKLYGPYKMPN